MIGNKETIYSKDLENNKITVTREFAAPVENVWRAWTESELLDQWWAPKPWKAVTTSMDFRVGGFWLYHMLGPDGSKQFCRADYTAISPEEFYDAYDAFCDENGTPNSDIPSMTWHNEFQSSGDGTTVKVEITYQSAEAMQAIIEMGFEEGFAAGMGNLDELLAEWAD